MKHWLLIGTAIVIAAILLFRSRVSTTSTIPPPLTTTPTTLPVPSATTLPVATQPALR